MSGTPHNPGLNRFAAVTAVTTLMLVGLGGLVTSHGVGMAVPDWPNTYGYNMFLFPISQWVGGVFYEHTHRLLASFVGLLTSALAFWLWARETRGAMRWGPVGLMGALVLLVATLIMLGVTRNSAFVTLGGVLLPVIGYALIRYFREPSAVRWLGLAALAGVILQGVLGGMRVVLFKDQIGIFHATLAQLFLVLVSSLVLLTSRRWLEAVAGGRELKPGRGTRALLLGTTVLILAQLVVGAAMRHEHAGLAVPDFPLAYGKIWPATDDASIQLINQQRLDVRGFNPISATHIWVHMAHRVGAVLILGAVVLVAWRLRRDLGASSRVAKVALGWAGLIGLQATLGAVTVWTNKAADVATLHVVVGAASLVTGALLTVTVFKFSFAVNPRVLHARGDLSVTPVAPAKTAGTTA